MLARTGLSLPDIMCVGNHESGARCLLSIQVKTWESRPLPMSSKDPDNHKRFDWIVKNVSRNHFFRGHPEQRKGFKEHWKGCLEVASIYHLRIIVCWAGFTTKQSQLVDHFNELQPSQPIVLAFPTEAANCLYGTLASDKLCQGVSRDPWKMKRQLMKMTEEEYKDFEKIANITLEPEEILMDILNL